MYKKWIGPLSFIFVSFDGKPLCMVEILHCCFVNLKLKHIIKCKYFRIKKEEMSEKYVIQNHRKAVGAIRGDTLY